MADSQKNNILVVVLVILALYSTPSNGFTQELQQYTDAIAKRSFNVMEYFEKDSRTTRFFQGGFVVVTFFVALYEFITLVTGWLSGFGMGLPLLGAPPTEMVKAREDGEQREQRFLDAIDDQVKAAVMGGLNEFENELKKKK